MTAAPHSPSSRRSAKEPVKIGFAAMAIPLSRGEMEFAAKQAPELGMTALAIEVIPPPTADYTPFATKLKDAGANWVFSWAPWVTQVRTFEALRRLDWKGDYIAWSHLEAEGELKRIKDSRLMSSAPMRCSRTSCRSRKRSPMRRRRLAASIRLSK